jgi:hypothetical protein
MSVPTTAPINTEINNFNATPMSHSFAVKNRAAPRLTAQLRTSLPVLLEG